METRKLRTLKVSAIGMGCMGYSHGYGPAPAKEEAVKLIRSAYEAGCTFFDTAESYGDGANESLVGEALQPIRQQVVIATKIHIPEDSTQPAAKIIRAHLEASLKRLGTDYVDLYYQHRVNKTIPVEEVAACMGDLIKEGKIRGWGQSKPTPEEVRRAHAITPMTAIQDEFSIMERSVEQQILPLCKELNIGFVAFSPMASGFLSGKTHMGVSYIGDDVRRVITRFQGDNFMANQPLLRLLQQYAAQKGVTTAQLALAWILRKQPFMVPIPGMRSMGRIAENLQAADVVLTEAEYQNIEQELAKITIYGNRTDEDIAKLKNML